MSRPARRLPLFVLAALAGALLAVAAPGIAPGDAAPPGTASFTAQDYAWHVTGDATSSSATIAKGGTVTFGYPSGISTHNADFATGPAPTSCTQTAGAPGGTPPPLPTSPTAAGWSGTCRFDTPGTYTFHCDLHTYMRGTIVVVDPNAPPPSSTSTGTTTAPPASPGTTTATGTAPAPGAGPAPTHAALRLVVARVQRGATLRGSVTAPAAGARADVTALVSSSALGGRRGRHARQVRVGFERVRTTGAGATPFAVTLNATARRALHRRHRLAVVLRIVVTPPHGARVVRTVAVTVRERRAAPPAPAYPTY